jgi:hypothetical protein
VPIADTKKQLDKIDYSNGQIAVASNSRFKPSESPGISVAEAETLESVISKSAKICGIEMNAGTMTSEGFLILGI